MDKGGSSDYIVGLDSLERGRQKMDTLRRRGIPRDMRNGRTRQDPRTTRDRSLCPGMSQASTANRLRMNSISGLRMPEIRPSTISLRTTVLRTPSKKSILGRRYLSQAHSFRSPSPPPNPSRFAENPKKKNRRDQQPQNPSSLRKPGRNVPTRAQDTNAPTPIFLLPPED